MLKKNLAYDIKKIVLVAPPMKPELVWGELSEWREGSPPLGICSIAAYIREQGFDVSLIDAEILNYSVDKTVEEIIKLKPDLVGLTCKTLWVKSGHRVAKKLKTELPDLPVIAGGHHPTALPESTLKDFSSFDLLVLGEGELTFLELLQYLQAGKDLKEVKGLAFMEAGKPVITPKRERIKDLDILPLAAIDLLPGLAEHYKASMFFSIEGPNYPVMTSRGCPEKCTFCDRSVYQNRVTYHSPRYIIKLVKELRDNHGLKHIIFHDDNLFLKRSRLYELLDLLKTEKIKLKFTAQGRIDSVDKEMLKKLKKAGCVRILYGIESGSQSMLDSMKKRTTVEKAREVIKMTHKLGILTVGLFIFGYPGETEETLKATYNLIKECHFDDVLTYFFLPLPGSEAYHNLKGMGTYQEDFENNNSLAPTAFIAKDVTAEQLIEYKSKSENACYSKFFQLFSIPRRCPTKAHYDALMKMMKQTS